MGTDVEELLFSSSPVTSLLEAASSPALKIRVDYKKWDSIIDIELMDFCLSGWARLFSAWWRQSTPLISTRRKLSEEDLSITLLCSIVTANTMSLMASKIKGESPAIPKNIMEQKRWVFTRFSSSVVKDLSSSIFLRPYLPAWSCLIPWWHSWMPKPTAQQQTQSSGASKLRKFQELGAGGIGPLLRK